MKYLLLPLSIPIWLFIAITSHITVYTIGIYDKYSLEHKQFLKSGFLCRSCKSFLLKWTLMGDVIVKDIDGNEIPAMESRNLADSFTCPRCYHS